MPRNNNNRITPDVIRNYNLNPTASVVDKQLKYTPQLEETGKLKNIAQGLADLARGTSAINTQLAREASDSASIAYAKTKNKQEWAEVSKNIDGLAKFNPYNKEVYKTLRANTIVSNGNLKYQELSKTCQDLTPEKFEAQIQAVQDEVLANIKAENLNANQTEHALEAFQRTQGNLRTAYVGAKAERDYQIVQNQIISTSALDIATMTSDPDKGFLNGWNESVKKLTETANGLGMNNTKQFELFTRAINQYLVDNVDDIDAEEFIIAVAQTKINGQALSNYDPNYTESMKQLLMKAKRAKYESDSLDLQIEKLRLEQETLSANAEMFKLMSNPNATDAEILNKANELIETGGMQAIGFNFLQSVVGDKNTLLTLRTTTTNPETNNALMQKYITGTLSQDDIVKAFQNKQLSPSDAYTFFNNLQSKESESYNEQLKALNELYLDKNPTIDLGETNKNNLTKAVYDTISNPNLTKGEKAQALTRIKGVAEHMAAQKEVNESKDPSKLLTASYMKTQHAKDQSVQDAQRYLAKMGLFKNQMGFKDTNIKVTSPMQASRTVTGTDGKTVTRVHYGTDVSTYLGRTLYAPMTGKVLASGYDKSMGNYLLFECEGRGYIKLMHLQAANLPKAGTYLTAGSPLAHVGNSGFVTTKSTGVLHIECFNTRRKLVNPKEFMTGK